MWDVNWRENLSWLFNKQNRIISVSLRATLNFRANLRLTIFRRADADCKSWIVSVGLNICLLSRYSWYHRSQHEKKYWFKMAEIVWKFLFFFFFLSCFTPPWRMSDLVFNISQSQSQLLITIQKFLIRSISCIVEIFLKHLIAILVSSNVYKIINMY